MTDAELEALKEATRTAHEAIKDLRLAIREATEAGEVVRKIIHDEIYDRIDSEVAAGLGEYKTTLSGAIDDATDRVMKRFDELSAILLGEDKKARRKRLKTIPEYVEERAGTGREEE